MLSPYYVDSATDKSRELDLLCEKEIGWSFAGRQAKSLRIQLFVECKCIPQPVVFWFDARDNASTLAWLDANTPFKYRNSYQDQHHYIKAAGDVAKLFSSGGGKLEENDPIYKALTQCLGGLIHNRGLPSTLKSPTAGAAVTTLRYPIIVHSSATNFHRTEVR